MPGDIRVTPPQLERAPADTFVPTDRPRVSWRTETGLRDWMQTSARIEVVRGGTTEIAEVIGDSSVFVEWPFSPLRPLETATVRVMVHGTDGSASEWSNGTTAMCAVLDQNGWQASFVGTGENEPSLLRLEFETSGTVRQATLRATALGVYQAELNGIEVDDAVLKPGWTSYQWRVPYESTDVTSSIVPGRNILGFMLAGGWFTERFGFRDAAARFYEGTPAVSAELVIEYEDGRVQTVLTDESVRWSRSPVISSSLYQGESFDARLAIRGWSTTEFDDLGWNEAVLMEGVTAKPEPRTGPLVRCIETLPIHEVITTPAGATVVDFGQNLVGWLRIRVAGPRGQTITIRHAEVLENGELGVRPLRNAAATDTYTLSGEGVEYWEPRFTFHGFRYAQIDGWPGELDPSAISAVVVHSDMARIGGFSSSHALVNRLHENVLWGMRGNFLSIPSDCPQRDERLGWTGDIQVFAPTASFLYDCDSFLTSWLTDLGLEQRALGGVVPMVVPSVIPQVPGFDRPIAAWGDAATVIPSVLFERFGDLSSLRDQYSSMRDWVDILIERASDELLWQDGFQFGDWLDPDASPDRPGDAKVDADIVATAYFYRSVDLTADAASLLDHADDAERYSNLAGRIGAAFRDAFVSPRGRIMSDASTAYALAIQFGLFAGEEQRREMGERLAFLVRASGYRISTGFVGTPLVCDALTATGHLDAAARLLTQTENPSWLYPVTMGATTIWERWDSMLEDGSINPGQMTSFNHYALGAVADWLHRSVAGLAPNAPGYKRISIAPTVLDGFDHAQAWHDTPYGRAEVEWRVAEDEVIVSVVIPPNTSADITLPSGIHHLMGSGSYTWTEAFARSTRARGHLSLGSSLAAIVDDPEAYRAVWTAIAQHDEQRANDFRRHTRWTPGGELREPLNKAPLPILRDIERALSQLETAEPQPVASSMGAAGSKATTGSA